MAAPAMAVSQVDTLKNPCTLWMWNSLVASQPPSSAPAMPIRQVRMRPCCLRPGISMLAIRPAARPKTIHAMMLMTDSLARWSDRDGRKVRDAAPAGHRQKNSGPPVRIHENCECGYRGPEQPVHATRLFPRAQSAQ